MAITKLGPPLAGLRGTVGGITFSENGTTTYAKIWSRPSNPQTSKQTGQRGFLSQMPALWNGLTAGQKAGWSTFAALPAQELFNSLGESYFASAWNWFCKCNLRLLRVGRAVINTQPTQARPAAPSIDEFRITPAGPDPNLTIGGTPLADSSLPPNFPANAFDNDNSTWWKSAITPFPHWLEYQMAAPVAIKRFEFTGLDVSTTLTPVDFTLESWNGISWDVHLTVLNDPAWQANEIRKYWLPTPTFARNNWRINVTRSNLGTLSVVIPEMRLYAADFDSSVIIYPEDEFVDSPDYDLILHIAPGISTGKQVQYPGFAEILAAQDPPRQASSFQDELEGAFGTILEDRAWFAQLYRQTAEGIRSTAATDRTETI